MDKFLVSSPTQLSQPFDLGGESLMYMNNSELYNLEQFNADNSNPSSTNDETFTRNDQENMTYSNNSINNSNDEIVPISQNNSLSQHSRNFSVDPNFGLQNFNHSKTILLDEMAAYNNFTRNDDNQDESGIYSSGINMNLMSGHSKNLSVSSQFSVNQDPPTSHYQNYYENNLHKGYHQELPPSHSHNTLYSTDSIPPLSSSVSNQSLSDSPSSQHPQNFYHLHPPSSSQHHNKSPTNTTSTPARIGRMKSASFSNSYTTPLRTGNANMSPVNLASASTITGSLMNKVVKTPHSAKVKHSRSRSRISLDGNSNNFLNQATKSASFQNLSHSQQPSTSSLNPFYTPSSFISPKVESVSSELDDIGTPLQTPGGFFSNSKQMNTYFSPVNKNTHSQPGSATSVTTYTSSRNDTLDLIKIEDQDDDAFKQLRKAKSNSNFNINPETASKLNAIANKRMNHNQESDMDLSKVNFESHFDYSVSSNSTPGNFYGQNSMSRSFTPVQGYPMESQTYNNSLADLQNTQNMSLNYQIPQQMHKPPTVKSNSSIDLLLPQLIHNKTMRPDLKRSATAFTKSFPASMDLASITNAKLGNQQYTGKMNGLLPPMATFSNLGQPNSQPPLSASSSVSSSSTSRMNPSHGQSIQEVADSIMSSDMKLPIKVNEKVDNTDPKKKHQCPLCQARFQRPEHVKRHLKSHSSEKPYQCEEANCGKRFNRKDNLKAHLKKIHHKYQV